MRYRDLNAPPDRSMREIVEGLKGRTESGNTGAHGTKHMGMTGDQLWYRPDGREISVREVDEALVSAQDRIDEAATDLEGTQIRLEQAEQDVATVSGDLDRVETVVIPGAVEALEQADQAAQEQFDALDTRLGDFATDEALAPIRQALSDAQAAVETAQGVAETANQAANAASQAALEAAGIAESKGRVIIQDTEPTGEDRNAANIWIKPAVDDPDTEITETATTYVYLADTDTWMPTTSSELAQAAQNALDAREAAQQAQQRADTAVSNAATAQSAAEAAQRTADQATTDAREAHNEAVAAAEAARAAIERGDSLIANGSFELGTPAWPQVAGRQSVVEHEGARTGSRVMRLSPVSANAYPMSENFAVQAGQQIHVQMWYRYFPGDRDSRLSLYFRQVDKDGSSVSTGYANGSDGRSNMLDADDLVEGEWTLFAGTIPVTEGATHLSVGPHALRSATDIFHIDDLLAVDVTEVRKAQARAEEAYAEAASKATPAEVQAAADAAEDAAKDAAALDATAKAAQAKADALSEAAVTAQEKADAAQAQAVADAAQDAADKADKALQDALDALAAARGEITAEIRASANGKNSITISTSDPSGDGVVAGDTWWRVDGSGQIFGQWMWNGSWVPREIRSEVIANLDVHKLQVTGEAKMDSAVIDKLFTETFVAHKITGAELSISSVKSDGSLADGSVSAVTIKDGAITTPKLTVTEDMSAAIVSAMSVNTKRLVVTEDAILNHATLIGQTVVDDINVQGKIIGTNGVFTGTVDFANVTVTGTQIVNKLGANSISADKISGGSFAGKTFEGGSFRGGEFQAPAVPRWNGGIAISAAGGIQGWDYESNPSNPEKILQLGSSAYPNFVAGAMSTAPLGKPAAILTPVVGGGGKVGGGVWFSEDGSLGNDQAAIYSYLDGNIHIRPKDTVPRGTVFIDGNLIVRERTTFDNAVTVGSLLSSGAVVVGRSGNRKALTVHGSLRATHPGSGSGSANARYESNGQLVLVSSSRRYKRNIAEWNPEAERVLALRPRQWQHDDPDNPPEVGIDERWHVGFIAEEVDDLGLRGLVEYAGDGAGGWRPEALRYDRFAAAHQIVLQKHEAEIKELTQENAHLRDGLASIEARIDSMMGESRG